MSEQNQQNEGRQKQYSWNTGMPTAPDVELLLKHWTDLQIGDRLPYADVAAVVGLEVGTSRWRTVTNAWRKRLKEKQIVVECESGSAFYVATAEQISAGTHAVITGITGKARRHRQKLAAARPETEAMANVIQHQGRLMHTIERETKKHRTNLLPSSPPDQAPRIQPPGA